MRTLPKFVLLALITVYLVWGSTYLAIHFALHSFPPFLLMGTRFLAAGGVLFAWLKLRGAAFPTFRQWRDAGIVGILLLGCGMGLTAVAQQYVSSGLTAVFIASSPLMFALWSGLFGDWPSGREWAGILAGFAGAVLLAGSGDFAAQPIGVLALAGAVACWTFGSVLSQRKLALAPGAMGFASEMLVGGSFLLCVGLLRGEAIVTLDERALFAWAYLVTAGSLAGFSAYMYLLSKVPPALASSYAYVNPVIAVVLGVWLANESLGTRETVAMAIILGSVLLLTTARAAPKPAGRSLRANTSTQ
ncbi:drug/metabolite exporter YedA [Herbaspirillum sp. ST 5-3]|uniref:drug/metabolite exporter YedA n=1 Tax=Oxalobacteraceae TaxID=75682 RepID=UPI0010A391C5|nr:drug/metabolite exporter YedA [Herbaspirillum sp. ST 5-3]